MVKYLKKFPNLKQLKQSKKSSYNKKRTPKDSELNLNKTIKEQFNHLRINDNIKIPSFFIYKKTKYFIKIYKEKKIMTLFMQTWGLIIIAAIVDVISIIIIKSRLNLLGPVKYTSIIDVIVYCKM